MVDVEPLNCRPAKLLSLRVVVDSLMAREVVKVFGICSTLFIFTRTVSALDLASDRTLDIVMMALQV